MAQKYYQSAPAYEKKLARVMERIGADTYDFDWGRKSCYVDFTYNGRAYRFETSVEELQGRGVKITLGSDAFAILVLDLECIARMMEHGTFDLENQRITGLKQLAAKSEIPVCFRILQFDYIPEKDELKVRFRALVKSAHPDSGGSANQFIALQDAYDEALAYLEKDGK